MSIGEEIREQLETAYELWIVRYREKASKGIWTQKNGEDIRVQDMTTSHIENCINMIHRGDAFFKEITDCYLRVFESELKRRGVKR